MSIATETKRVGSEQGASVSSRHRFKLVQPAKANKTTTTESSFNIEIAEGVFTKSHEDSEKQQPAVNRTAQIGSELGNLVSNQTRQSTGVPIAAFLLGGLVGYLFANRNSKR